VGYNVNKMFHGIADWGYCTVFVRNKFRLKPYCSVQLFQKKNPLEGSFNTSSGSACVRACVIAREKEEKTCAVTAVQRPVVFNIKSIRNVQYPPR
jgi:hypothetical protein